MNILGISRLHNGSVCLLQDGKITYHIEEERLNHAKYEGTPFLGILKSREFIDTIDYVACCGFVTPPPSLAAPSSVAPDVTCGCP